MTSPIVFNLDEAMAEVSNYTTQEMVNFLHSDEDLLTKYIFRGWFLTSLLEEGLPESGRCPCCCRSLLESPGKSLDSS